MTFDLWRQLTVEHVIGGSQGGYLKDIRLVVAECFKTLNDDERESLARKIDMANTVTACSFCNSSTSRYSSKKSMGDLIRASTGTPDEIFCQIDSELRSILKDKSSRVKEKLESVRKAYKTEFLSVLICDK